MIERDFPSRPNVAVDLACPPSLQIGFRAVTSVRQDLARSPLNDLSKPSPPSGASYSPSAVLWVTSAAMIKGLSASRKRIHNVEPWTTIVGIVQDGPNSEGMPEVYLPYT